MSIFQLLTRLRKIEGQLKEPMEIVDPILNPGHSREYSRDSCIYGALIRSIEASMGLTEQNNIAQPRQNEELIRSVKIVIKSIWFIK